MKYSSLESSQHDESNGSKIAFLGLILDEKLNVSACHFEAFKAFTKPMLKDIEWMSIHDYLKSLAIKRMLKAKYNRKVYNQDLYKETKKAYSWILQYTIDATRLMPKVFVTDADPGMDTAIQLKYPSTFAIHYIQITLRSESVNGTFKRLLYNSNSTLVDILLKSTTIASNAFSDIISELKEFTTFPIQKIHYNEMELAFNYDAKLLDRSCIINEDLKDWSFY
ncbi:hypothetical protein RhiirA5_409973 [Rhizophagus irregularis]|uniref:Uncharacterized protein n=1 Tax=Rhizophagus irregularis TaxID=588596 RepID=A0A2I1DSH5_9GLOM|nr:hypothetical protein RhiirA5_409973 [Rhizophagus irregularis]PKY12799.1 hypothetical protein RhiirB3_424511 [Rhizophagus irregularis]